MALAPGTRLGPYDVTAQIGVGGMGEVYRATDTNLKRDVAIKVLPESVATDPERLARFQREAEVLAALNHPNIAQIHGVERHRESSTPDGLPVSSFALVMELVDGPTLADVIARATPEAERVGARSRGLPVDVALPIARQIVEALEAAHERGIIHRDLKPANVKVRDDGTVKVLDFGLAKAMEPAGGAAASASASMSPTITTPAMTQMGMILGTAAYMSPEQAKGRAVDARTDVWAFGCVLYEMLTGARAFEGDDVSEVFAGVIKLEPRWDALPPDLSPSVRTFVEACLRKDPRQRVHSIADVRLALDGAFETTGPQATEAVRPPVALPRWRRALPLAVTGVLVALVTGLAAWALRPRPAPHPVVRSVHALPEGRAFRNAGRTVVAIAPDGQSIVYNSANGLVLRPLGTFEDHVIPGTEAGLTNPVFSPNGQEVAYFHSEDSQLKRIAVSGGAPVVVSPATNVFGMSWEADGTIWFGQLDGIRRVPATGGTPELVIATEPGERASNPQALPGGWVLLTLRREEHESWDDADVVAVSISSGERRVLRTGGTGARYVPTGHLVYAFQNVLHALPFDLDRMAVTGGPVPVVQGVRQTGAAATLTGAAFYAFAADGTLAYVPGTAATATQTLAIVSRAGQLTRLSPQGAYDFPRVSPDGRSVAFTATYTDGDDIAVYELGTDTAPRRLTFGGSSQSPIWSADGERVIFESTRADAPGLYWTPADGTGAAERLTTPEKGERHAPSGASPDGQHVAFTVIAGPQNWAVWIVTLPGLDAQPLVATPGARIGAAVFSPDGRWLAYDSDETGEDEIFVQPFPPTGAKYQLPTTRDNHHPAWSPDGTQLFYIPGPDEFAVVSVTKEPRFTFGNPVPLANVHPPLVAGAPSTRRRFDTMPDGGFLGFTTLGQAGDENVPAVHIVQSWFEELKRLVPTNQ